MNEIFVIVSEQALYPFAASSIPFLIGLLWGHWIALGRDKRNEFNAAVDPLRERLTGGVISPQHAYGLSAVEHDRILSRCGFWRGRSIRRALAEHDKTKPQYTQNDTGQAILQNVDALFAANQVLAASLRRV